MKLSALEAQDSFALLGPGFGAGGMLLLSGLRPGRRRFPRLVFASFEGAGRAATVLGADSCHTVEVEFDVQPPLLDARFAARGYRAKVQRIRDSIAAGDVYQVCYTVRARLECASGAALLAAICGRGLPRFAAWVRLPGGPEFVSASPELFFEIAGSRIHAEPMKGTASAGAAAALEQSEKDRAELAMITDLIRNDLTPICRPRSVRVPCERRIVELPYAMQTVSDVTGILRAGVTPLDALAALHPGGSVTGAPKPAALRMIRELEPEPRGAYCGALGLWRKDGATFSLLIRTAQKDTAQREPGGWVYGLGGGIVYESSAARELDELHTKLGALRCATRRSG
ncbi:MAG: chorismate-binding protein [Candidatus Lambdaproteobacteria bacterium]|nr:chorismate-binding protein [Candidatus Lambdaproteobacteria bacterium]